MQSVANYISRESHDDAKCTVVTRVCVSVCLSAAACLHYCTDPDVTWWSGRGRLLVVHCWADLQSVHGLRCYGNITRTRNVSEYIALCLVFLVMATLRCVADTDIIFSSCNLFYLSFFVFPSPNRHHRTTVSGYIFATKARIDNRKKTC